MERKDIPFPEKTESGATIPYEIRIVGSYMEASLQTAEETLSKAEKDKIEKLLADFIRWPLDYKPIQVLVNFHDWILNSKDEEERKVKIQLIEWIVERLSLTGQFTDTVVKLWESINEGAMQDTEEQKDLRELVINTKVKLEHISNELETICKAIHEIEKENVESEVLKKISILRTIVEVGKVWVAELQDLLRQTDLGKTVTTA